MLCLTGIVCVAVGYPSSTLAEGSWVINRAHTVLAVTQAGQIKVTETIRVDLEQSHKTGITRHLPLKYTANHQVWFVEINNIKVQRNQVDEAFITHATTNELVVEVGDPRLNLTGSQEYTLNYTVEGALRHGEKTDFVYWYTTGGWETTVEQATAIVKLPQDGVANQRCFIIPSSNDECQSLSLNPTESRFAATDSLSPRAAMAAQIQFSANLVPLTNVRPPRIVDWLEVYRQPIIILASISGACFLAAGALWLKSRKT